MNVHSTRYIEKIMLFKNLGFLLFFLNAFAFASDCGSLATDLDSNPTDCDLCGHNQKKRKALNTIHPNDSLSQRHAPSVIKLCKSDTGGAVKRRIAIIGGGGAGSIIAALLANLSKEAEDEDLLSFEVTIFERNSDIINGSTFEVAAVLHAGGREYPTDTNTAAECQMTGELFQQMFPSLYARAASPILYLVHSDSSLTLEAQQITHTNARKKRKKCDLSLTSQETDSQSEIPSEIIQEIFSSKFSGGVQSRRDRLMNIFERNALLKKSILEGNVIVKSNTLVLRILQNEDKSYEVIHNGPNEKTSFDHVIITAWDGTPSILAASQPENPSLSPPTFIIEDRVIALCDIRHVAPLQNTPTFTLIGGGMFLPLTHEIGLVYRCMEGGSYPEAGATGILPKKALHHGQKIIDELKESFRDEESSKCPFEEAVLLGTRLHKIIKRADRPSSERRYESPIVTPEGFIIVTPPKATFIGSLALQTIEQLLRQLPDSFLAFKTTWIQKIQDLVPNSECLYTRAALPRAFIINPKSTVTKKDILTEKSNFFKSCALTKAGEDLHRDYQAQLESEFSCPLRKQLTNPVLKNDVSRSGVSIRRGNSDPFPSLGVLLPSSSSTSLIDLIVTSKHAVLSNNT